MSNSPIQCFAADLDDTLHDFGYSSSKAISAVIALVATESSINPTVLLNVYTELLKDAQYTNFTLDLPSREYRRRRFTRFLQYFGLLDRVKLEYLLDVYDEQIGQYILAFDGVQALFAQCKALGLVTMIITEGPYDAQLKVLRALKIDHLVDHLVTSSKEHVIKVEGLLERGVARVGIEPHRIMYVGDRYNRDYAPARALGMQAFLLRYFQPYTRKTYHLRHQQQDYQITSLRQLIAILNRTTLIEGRSIRAINLV